VASYYVDDKKYPDRKWVEKALAQVEIDIPRAEHGAHGWTKADAKDLRRIAQGLRYYLIQDYSGGSASHSTISRSARPSTKLTSAQRAYIAAVEEDVRRYPSAYKADVRSNPTQWAMRHIEGLDEADVRRMAREQRAETKLTARLTGQR